MRTIFILLLFSLLPTKNESTINKNKNGYSSKVMLKHEINSFLNSFQQKYNSFLEVKEENKIIWDKIIEKNYFLKMCLISENLNLESKIKEIKSDISLFLSNGYHENIPYINTPSRLKMATLGLNELELFDHMMELMRKYLDLYEGNNLSEEEKNSNFSRKKWDLPKRFNDLKINSLENKKDWDKSDDEEVIKEVVIETKIEGKPVEEEEDGILNIEDSEAPRASSSETAYRTHSHSNSKNKGKGIAVSPQYLIGTLYHLRREMNEFTMKTKTNLWASQSPESLEKFKINIEKDLEEIKIIKENTLINIEREGKIEGIIKEFMNIKKINSFKEIIRSKDDQNYLIKIINAIVPEVNSCKDDILVLKFLNNF
ncbi:unnamed protein product [Meloidogyne enterolobii]|uniref:Uncharacterized protein n=1 Tax=Meloidogyne enterolobii TaxID=390850 RepID=A0ACB0YIB7_MELEN